MCVNFQLLGTPLNHVASQQTDGVASTLIRRFHVLYLHGFDILYACSAVLEIRVHNYLWCVRACVRTCVCVCFLSLWSVCGGGGGGGAAHGLLFHCGYLKYFLVRDAQKRVFVAYRLHTVCSATENCF